jgi:hypothetical protein
MAATGLTCARQWDIGLGFFLHTWFLIVSSVHLYTADCLQGSDRDLGSPHHEPGAQHRWVGCWMGA